MPGKNFYSHARVGVTLDYATKVKHEQNFYSHARVGVTDTEGDEIHLEDISTPTPVWA